MSTHVSGLGRLQDAVWGRRVINRLLLLLAFPRFSSEANCLLGWRQLRRGLVHSSCRRCPFGIVGSSIGSLATGINNTAVFLMVVGAFVSALIAIPGTSRAWQSSVALPFTLATWDTCLPGPLSQVSKGGGCWLRRRFTRALVERIRHFIVAAVVQHASSRAVERISTYHHVKHDIVHLKVMSKSTCIL